MPKTHKNYHEVHGANGTEIGRALGERFGEKMRYYISESREMGGFGQRRRRGHVLWQKTAQHFPEYVRELQAYADAAGVDLLDLWTVSIEDELFDDGYEKCTTVVANNGRLIGHNEDWDGDAAEEICILKKTVGRATSLELYYYGAPLGGVALSISSRGHVQCINSLVHVDSQVGVPKSIIARAMSELECGSGGLEALLGIPRSSGFAHTLVDRNGRLTAAECSAMHHRVSTPKFPFAHSNHFLDPTLGRMNADTASASSLRRLESARAMASQCTGLVQLTTLVDDRSNGKTKSVFNKNTIARAIVDLDSRTVHFWLRREKKLGWVPYDIDFLF